MLDSQRRSLKAMYQKIRKSFYVTDFVAFIRPYVSLISVLGYFPYDTKLSSTKLGKKSFIGSVMKMIQITIICPLMIYKLRIIERTWEESYITLYFIMLCIYGLACLWTIFASSRSKVHLLRTISIASRVLSPDEFCNTAKWMFPIDIVKCFLFTCGIYDVGEDLSMTVIVVIGCYTFFVAMMMVTLFTNCLYVLSLCFRKINTSLEKLKAGLATGESHLLRRVYHSQKNPALLSELKMLRRQHLEFSRIIEAINETFGLEILVVVSLTVMDTTFNLYLYVAENTDDGKIVNPWSMKMCYIVCNSLLLITLAVFAEMVKDQVKNIGNNIHRILVAISDEQISTELELFSIQVLQQNHAIIAKGLVIDMTFLTKMVGIITTYLLILIQLLLMKTC